MIPWETIKIGELIDKGEASLQTGPFGTQLKASEYVATGIPLINVKNIGYGSIRIDDLDFLDERTADRLRVHRLKPGDIVFGRKGAADRHALIGPGSAGWIQGSDCMRLRLKSKRLSPRFLSYYFCTSGHKYWMEAVCAFGATMSTLNQGIVRRITLRVPEIGVQNKIAGILSAYDELIENNERRIALLEKLAKEIYREWFVRMRFPGHEQAKFEKGVPVSWEFDVASKFFGHVKGKSYTGDELTDNPDHMPFITLKSFNRGGGYRADGLKHYSGKYKEDQVVLRGDVVMAVTDMTQNREVVGRAARIPEIGAKGAVISLDVIKLTPKIVSASFLYSYLRLSGFGEFIKEFANGTNVLHLNPVLVMRQRIIMPPKELREQFVALVGPIYDQIDSLNIVLDGITSSRDMLLPRLVSGKLNVENLDIQFPPCMREGRTAITSPTAYA